MSSNEIYVVIALGLVGYWGTSALIRFFKRESAWTSDQNTHKAQEQPKSSQTDSKSTAWFDVLEISPTSSLEQIRSAYKRKISMYHPDKVSAMGPEFNEIAQRKSKEINSAYDEAVRLKGQ